MNQDNSVEFFNETYKTHSLDDDVFIKTKSDFESWLDSGPKLIHCDDPVLHTLTAEIHPRMFTETELVSRAAQVLVAQLMAMKAVGIAAPQMGLPYAMIVVPTKDDATEFLVACNPKIFENTEPSSYTKKSTGIEGCLSYPFVQVTVSRLARIDVDFLDIKGNPRSGSVDGFAATVWQHEFDHLMGITMQDRVTSLHWEYAKEDGKRREKKYRRKFKEMAKEKGEAA
jgi:peptide deformylase